MKTILSTFLILMSFNAISAQLNRIEVTLNNDKVLYGYGTISPNRTKIVFRETKFSDRIKYDHDDVKLLRVRNDSTTTYKFYYVTGRTTERDRVQLIPIPTINGKINLHYEDFAGTYTQMHGNGFNSYGTDHITLHYISKPGENTAYYLGKANTNSERFSKFAKTFFKDCPILIEKMNDKAFRKKGIVEIVKFYNENCEK